MRVGVHKVLMNSPSDVSGLERLIDAKTVDPKEIVASIGKTDVRRSPVDSWNYEIGLRMKF